MDAYLCVACGSPDITTHVDDTGHATKQVECLDCGAIEDTADLVRDFFLPIELELLWAGAPVGEAPPLTPRQRRAA